MNRNNQHPKFKVRWIRVIGIPFLLFIIFFIWISVVDPWLFRKIETVNRQRMIFQFDTSTNIIDLAWNPNSKLLAFLDENRTISVINVETREIDLQLNIPEEEISAISWDATGNNIITISRQNKSWDYQNNQWQTPTQILTNINKPSIVSDWNAYLNLIAIGWEDGNIIILDVVDGYNQLIRFYHEDAINDLGWSPDGHMLASVGRDGNLFIWYISETDLLER